MQRLMAEGRRIAFISEHASPLALLGSVDAGGQNVYVDEVSRHLGSLGYRVDVFVRRDHPDTPTIVEWAPQVRIIQLDAGPVRWIFKDQLWPFMPEFRDALLRHATRENVHYDLVHGNFWMSGWVAAQLKKRLGIPAVQIFHATGKTKQRHQQSADTSPDERIAIESSVIRTVDRIIAQCPSEYDELVDDYGSDPDKVVVIPSAVNIQTYRPVTQVEARQCLGLQQDELLVVYVGRMLPRKDVRNVVRAMGILASQTRLPVRLLLVGGETVDPDPVTTPEIGVLQQLATDLNIGDRVIFTGKRQPQELYLYYGAGDVAVTTPWYEPFGLTPLEAMACGRPVIGSAVGGIPFTIEDGVTGVLVPPQDPEALAAELLTLLADKARRERMGDAGRARVERHFVWSVVARRTASLYETLLNPATGEKVAGYRHIDTPAGVPARRNA